MRSIFLTTALAIASSSSFSQYCAPWPTTNPNTGQSGYVGIGTRSSIINNTPLPNFNLHLHGTTDYIYDDGISGLNPVGGGNGEFQTKSLINYGKTTRLGMTNTTTGMTENDGTVLRMSGNDFTLHNRESGYLSLKSSSVEFKLSGVDNRAYLGGTPSNPTTHGRLCVNAGGDNGIYVDNASGNKYGVTVRCGGLTNTGFQVWYMNSSNVAFAVKGNGSTEINYPSTTASDKLFTISNPNRKILQVTNDGILRSREIIVDAQTWSDYVFEPEYKLMNLSDLKTYISENGHLPNVPSTSEVEAEGVNVAKTDALLLEKIEELTLYLLQQEERMKALETEIDALKKEQSGNK